MTRSRIQARLPGGSFEEPSPGQVGARTRWGVSLQAVSGSAFLRVSGLHGGTRLCCESTNWGAGESRVVPSQRLENVPTLRTSQKMPCTLEKPFALAGAGVTAFEDAGPQVWSERNVCRSEEGL